MSDALRTHPDANRLAAFLEGRLTGGELRDVSVHVESCAECLEMVGVAAELERGSPPLAARTTQRTRSRRWIPLAVAAAVAVAAGLGVWAVWRARSADPAAPLYAALAPLPRRPVEARISGASWAPHVVLRSARPGPADEDELRLAAAAAAVLRKSRGRAHSGDQRAAGLAALLSGDAATSVTLLARAASLDPSDPRIWSDLAAARYELARSTRDHAEMARAVEAADRALALQPGSAAASFNRALALEWLGRTDLARRSFDAARRGEPAGGWAEEAGERAGRLAAR